MVFSEPSEDIEKMRPPLGTAFSFTAGAAITAGQVVKLTGDQTVQPADTNGEAAIGVAAQTVASGDELNVLGTGARVLFTAGESISAQDELTPATGTNNGEVGTASATGDNIVGYALDGSASSQGDTFVGVVDLGGQVN